MMDKGWFVTANILTICQNQLPQL